MRLRKELIDHLHDQQMEAMLANEFGDMNEVYADAKVEPLIYWSMANGWAWKT